MSSSFLRTVFFLLAKVRKVAEAMGASIYPIDANANARFEALRGVSDRLDDLNVVLQQANANRYVELGVVGQNLRSWENVPRREKMVHETLNLFSFDVSKRTLVAEGWVPTLDISAIQTAIRRASVGRCACDHQFD
jgi:V-type H+-transporting ATPase subunit a